MRSSARLSTVRPLPPLFLIHVWALQHEVDLGRHLPFRGAA